MFSVQKLREKKLLHLQELLVPVALHRVQMLLLCGCPDRNSHLEKILTPQVFQVTRNSCSWVALRPLTVSDDYKLCRQSESLKKLFPKRWRYKGRETSIFWDLHIDKLKLVQYPHHHKWLETTRQSYSFKYVEPQKPAYKRNIRLIRRLVEIACNLLTGNGK